MAETAWIDKLKVAELKDELKKRGLPISGKKAELATRLREHVIAEESAAAEAAPEPEQPEDAKDVAAGTIEEDEKQEEATDANAPAAMEVDEPTPAKRQRKKREAPTQEDVHVSDGFGLIPSLKPTAAPGEDDAPRAEQQPKDLDMANAQAELEKPTSKSEEPATKRKPTGALTMTDINRDALTSLATETWSSTAIASNNAPAFDLALVEKIYNDELGGGQEDPPLRRVALLELSQYLENYLWPGFTAETGSSVPLLHSIVLMVNEKFREGVPAWDCFGSGKDKFKTFFASILGLPKSHPLTPTQSFAYLEFLSNAFQSLENGLVGREVLRLVGLPLWHSLSRGRLQLELHEHQQLTKPWKSLAKKEAKAQAIAEAEGNTHMPIQNRPEAAFLPSLITDFFNQLSAAVTDNGAIDAVKVKYCERFVRFLSDLLSQLPTRRFVHALLEDKAVLVHSRMAPLHNHPGGALFARLVDVLRSWLAFPIDDHSGDALKEDSVTAIHYERLQQFQRLLFKHWPKLKDAALTNCGTLEKRQVLTKFLSELSSEELHALVTKQLRLVDESDPGANNPAFLTEVMLTTYERRRPQREVIEAMPLYPTEAILLDDDAVPADSNNATLGDGVLTLPRLNLQFLTLDDYLVRNFHLFRLEAAYEIREDIADVVRRIGPYVADDFSIRFSGWARMANPLAGFSIIEVRNPKVGETAPARVTAEVVIDTKHMKTEVRAEWDQLKQHDVVFLLSIRPDSMPGQQVGWSGGRTGEALQRAGLKAVRGCEVVEIKDQAGKLMNDFTGRVPPEERGPPAGSLRTLTVALDPTQYQIDTTAAAANASTDNDIYTSFNLLVRRHAKENNFKSVLESIRDLVADEEAGEAIPSWLHDVILGYGDPEDAQFKSMDDECQHSIDFKDTFLDATHVQEAFPEYKVEFKPAADDEIPRPPFRITFPSFAEAEEATEGKKKRKAGDDKPAAAPSPRLLVESYKPADPGPYPEDAPPLNTVRFTPVQSHAILSGVQPGLTMVVGPPGTGKTDTAVQIMHILYHNHPNQRTLVITHSNQALNDLFQKIVERDVPPRHLLRLGMGEADLDTEEEFSRVGRVNAMLARRLELLVEVEKLAKTLKLAESVAYTCETAAHFWLLHVLSRWEKFRATIQVDKTPRSVVDSFPFHEYFADAPGTLFAGEDWNADWSRALGCFRHLKRIFQELEEIRPFEVLRTQSDRINYLLMKQAKVVAMTCTHAALKRKEFLDLGFTFDNLLMEETAQVLEIETALPMLLQRAEDGQSRLKRVILIGDHHQLPPVVKNTALQRYSRMDQSLFSRFIRLGAPYLQLNAQGRAKPSIAALYNWRYDNLGDLPSVTSSEAFRRANAGFAFDYQLIDVPDFHGRGESEPTPFFYQNLGEAEYLVSVYQYMRLLGYAAESISMLTTYNGQRALLEDVVERRCAHHPMFGRPKAITTVDKYQGQQNEYVLLSLVRTRHFGHLRDVRRLVVAMSRARLGLYVFARAGLFANCYELQPTFQQLLARPVQLALVAGERFGEAERAASDAPADALLVQSVEHMASIVQNMASGG